MKIGLKITFVSPSNGSTAFRSGRYLVSADGHDRQHHFLN